MPISLADLHQPSCPATRIIVIETALEQRLGIIEAKTRTASSPSYQINPSGRVPYPVDDTGIGMEEAQYAAAKSSIDLEIECSVQIEATRTRHSVEKQTWKRALTCKVWPNHRLISD